MTRLLTALLACALYTGVAHTEPKGCVLTNAGREICAGPVQRIQSHPRASRADPRPRAWCGWWLRQQLGVADRRGNLARWWASYGSRASGPAVGVIVVWARGRRGGHVGIITGKTDDGWLVKSGNDGNAVRERVRSVKNAIALRWPHQQWAAR